MLFSFFKDCLPSLCLTCLYVHVSKALGPTRLSYMYRPCQEPSNGLIVVLRVTMDMYSQTKKVILYSNLITTSLFDDTWHAIYIG